MKKSSKSSIKRSPAPVGMNSVSFARAARALSLEAREWGHSAPSFRSPPRIAGARRSLTTRPDGSISVAVATRNRSATAVLSDMIEGLVRAVGTGEVTDGALRDALWESVEPQLGELMNFENSWTSLRAN